MSSSWRKWSRVAKWSQQACTTMFFLIFKNVTRERPVAFMPTVDPLVASLESTGSGKVAVEVVELDWDATDGRNGGAQQTVWESIDGNGKIKMEEQKQRIEVLWPWCWTLRRHSSESAFLWSGLGRRFSASHGRSCGCCPVTFEHQRRVQLEGCVAEPPQTITAMLLGSQWSCLLLCIVLQDALSEVMKIYPSLKLRVFVGAITALAKGRKKDVTEMSKQSA